MGAAAQQQQLFDEALSLHLAGRAIEAEGAYLRILDGQPNHADALHLLGVVRQQHGDHQGALGLIGRAIELKPAVAVYHNNYGAALFSLGRFAEAEISFRKALEIRANYADAFANLGMVQVTLGKEEAALESLRKALGLDPQHRDARKRLATLLSSLGRENEGVRLLERALADHPSAESYADLGNLLMTLGRIQEAAAAYGKSIALKPRHTAAHFNLGQTLEDLHDTTEARNHFSQASELRPEKPLWRLRAELCGPAVFENAGEIEEYCNRAERVLEECRTPHAPREAIHHAERDEYGPADVRLDDLLEAGVIPGFGVAFHGRDQRRLKEQFARLYEPCFRDQPAPAGSGSRDRPRVGILVTQRHEGMFLQSMRGVIEQLDGERFEPVILCSRTIVKTLQARIRRNGLRFVPFDDSLTCAMRQVRETACDLIYYWKVGTDALNYFLPFGRLAPVQCTGWATMPGKLFVGRVTQAFYRKMGVADLVVHSPAEYVRKAVQVATDRDYRKHVTERIAQASDVLFNDLEAVREHERFFEEALAEHSTRPYA